jgi:ribosomal protein S18 acetylase RimI-like enzyme
METRNPNARLTATASLSPEERQGVEALLEACNHAESIDIPIFLPDLEAGPDARTAILIKDGDALIAFAAVPDDSIPEASLMVHPDHRRRGLGSRLIAEIRAEVARRALPGCLLAADQASPSGRAFLAALDIPHDFSEYRLEFDPQAIDRSRPRYEALTLRPATPDDAETLIRVLAAAFNEPDDHARGNVAGTFAETDRHFYLAELDGEPIGAIRVGEWGGNGDVTAFGVIPEQQGKGYGRQILLDAVDLLLPRKLPRILIEVAVENRNALGLYESCGFRIAQEYGYYTLAASDMEQ